MKSSPLQALGLVTQASERVNEKQGDDWVQSFNPLSPRAQTSRLSPLSEMASFTDLHFHIRHIQSTLKTTALTNTAGDTWKRNPVFGLCIWLQRL